MHWDGDGRKDLLAGQSDGRIKLFLNIGTDADPQFDGGTWVLVGEPGAKVDIDVGSRATPAVVDWNGDGRKDLVIGALDGKLYLFLNEGTDTAPDFRTQQLVQDAGADLMVPTARSSPVIRDLDHDGLEDVLTGNTEGQLLLYTNRGTNQAPIFAGYVAVESDGTPIDLPSSARSRPFVCEWDADGDPDVLIGAGDGLVRLYRGAHGPVDVPVVGPLAGGTVPRLLAVVPNPARSEATIPFVMPGIGYVRLSVVDVRGRTIAHLAEGRREPGMHHARWNGRDDQGRRVAAGTYFVRMESAGIVDGEKVSVVR